MVGCKNRRKAAKPSCNSSNRPDLDNAIGIHRIRITLGRIETDGFLSLKRRFLVSAGTGKRVRQKKVIVIIKRSQPCSDSESLGSLLELCPAVLQFVTIARHGQISLAHGAIKPRMSGLLSKPSRAKIQCRGPLTLIQGIFGAKPRHFQQEAP